MRRLILGTVIALVVIVCSVQVSGQANPPAHTGKVSNPAAGSQATTSAAAISGIKHIADCVGFSAAAASAPVATALTINLRDGATGAGTILQTWQVVVTAATGTLVAPFAVCGLHLEGTNNTAMTLEFSAALANLIESVSLTYHEVNATN